MFLTLPKKSLSSSLLAVGLLLSTGGFAPSLAAAEVGGLEAAYQKEFAFLETQKRELSQRLQALKEQTARDEAKLRADIEADEQNLLSLESATDRLNALLLESEQAIELNQSHSDTLAATFDQAGQSLADYGYAVVEQPSFEQGDDVQKLSLLFVTAGEAASELASIRQTTGEFYLADGAQVSGSIVHLGNIASFGISERGTGPLAPAGGGAMKLWGENDPGTAQALLAGDMPDVLRLFLYESTNQAMDEKPAKTLLDTIDSAGIIGWVIVGLGSLAMVLILLRALFLRNAGVATGRLMQAVSKLVSEGRVGDALDLCKKTGGATARVLADTLRNLDRDRDHLEDIISESILHESGSLNRFGSFIMVIAAVAPLLGLLGTVTGMIATFDVITEFGTGDPKLLSGGIATALVTTELGLVVAIPTLIFGNLLGGWSNRIKDEMEKAALHVTNLAQSAHSDLRLAA